MRQIELLTGAFRPETPQAESHEILVRLLETLTELDRDYLKRHPRTPPLYRSRVRYQREPPGQEQWRTIPVVWKDGYGDCEDLAAWRVAELRNAGVHARPCFRYRQDGKRRIYHIMVCLPGGLIEDPSTVLGMRWDENTPPTVS
jgi:hypothetical protein